LRRVAIDSETWWSAWACAGLPNLGECLANKLTGAGHKLAIATLRGVGLAIARCRTRRGTGIVGAAGNPVRFAKRSIVGVEAPMPNQSRGSCVTALRTWGYPARLS